MVTVEAAAVPDKESNLRLGAGIGEPLDKDEILDDLQKIIQDEEVSDEVLMTGIWLMIVAFDGSDRRCIRLAHAYLDAMQDKEIYYRRTLVLLWLLYEAGDREYVSSYRFGRYEPERYYYPDMTIATGDSGVKIGLKMLEETAYGNLPPEFLLLLRDSFNRMGFGRTLSAYQAVLRRLEDKYGKKQEWMKILKKLEYLSGCVSMEEMLKFLEAASEEDSWHLYRFVKTDSFSAKPAGEKCRELMALLRWSKDCSDKILYNECIMMIGANT
jgi:hypothetical protein